MKNGVYILALYVLLCVRPASTDSEMVWLTDATTSVAADKRTLSDFDLPDDVIFHLRGRSHDMTLNLKRNRGIDPNADIYIVRRLKDGPSRLEKTQNLEKEDLAYYQDVENGAFMTVRCVRRSNGHCDRLINGNIRIIDKYYELKPAESDITSRDSDTTYRLGTRYVLRQQANIQRDIAVEDKNSAEINEEMKVNERIYKLRRFPHGERNHLLSSTFLAREKKNGNAVYWIEVAVLTDSSIWDLFHSLTGVGDHKVKRNIRQFYSHVLNGVDLLYKGIDDDSIKISVTLRKFFILETMDQIDHTKAKVIERRGKRYIDARKYLKAISEWDKTFGSESGIEYDHAMLFTRYDLYESNYRYNAINGLSYDANVCDTGNRTSLIEVGDSFSTVSTAAHELGHNLGADHDGEEKAVLCKAEDFFIMSAKNPAFDPAKLYSKNPWKFSTCSVAAFKMTLKNKQCVTNKGIVFDETEWNTYVKQEPGEAYSLHEQCEFINGPKSRFCGEESANICLFMKCTDPRTTDCQSNYVSAARGTECGPNKWCIDGWCETKPPK